ncbi:SH3 domain-containing protein [Sporomusa malonica]|uniref:SH3 domain-containing protein n=1 Tax=Sporomusa malonica TaxID=112901 RepID=A0A1W2EDX3_9FIRM|nr:SH3 domain-containing protein [Sporomusa malonica]SMD07950.1 SH3 domain-containing protein [Sporomusa malonica]
MKKRKFTFVIAILAALAICLSLPAHAVFTAVTNTDKVKLFAEPTPTSPIVEVLKLGDVVKIYKKSPDGEFWEVEHKGNHGWIILKFLSPKDHRYSTEA